MNNKKTPAVTLVTGPRGLSEISQNARKNSAKSKRATSAAQKILTRGSLLGVSFAPGKDGK
jgi:hypothetical protein